MSVLQSLNDTVQEALKNKPLNHTVVETPHEQSNGTVIHDTLNNTINISDSRFQSLRGLAGKLFLGSWRVSNDIYPVLERFKEDTGKFKFRLFIDRRGMTIEDKKAIPALLWEIYDGQYEDDGIYTMILNNSAFDMDKLIYSIPSQVANVSYMGYKDIELCETSVTLDLSKLIVLDPQSQTPKYKIDNEGSVSYQIMSSNCTLNIEGSAKFDDTDYEKKTVNYSIFLTLLAIVNIYSVAKMVRKALEGGNEANKYSMLTIGFLIIWDTYICLAHLTLALVLQSLFHFFVMPTFWYFILSSIFEMRLLTIVWKSRYWNDFNNAEQIRRGRIIFHCKFYLGMIVFLTFFVLFISNNFFLFLMNLYLVPQIVHNVMRGGRVDFDLNYMLVIGLRAFLPLYFRGCPDNFLEYRPSAIFCISLIIIMVLQIGIIYFQSIYGAKFFIPAQFLPPQYNYLHNLPEDLEAGLEAVDDCAVCMNPLNHESLIPQHDQNPHTRLMLMRLRPQRGQIMRTPCNHKFHVSCLVEWMSIKMECPTCRARLPALE